MWSGSDFVLTEEAITAIKQHANKIIYSERYSDDTHEYRHVTLPKEIARFVPRNRLMSEKEWRMLGVQQSTGWTHYLIHKPELHILLYSRPIAPAA